MGESSLPNFFVYYNIEKSLKLKLSSQIKKWTISEFKPAKCIIEGRKYIPVLRHIFKSPYPIKNYKTVLDLFKCSHCKKIIGIIHDLNDKPLTNYLACQYCKKNIFSRILSTSRMKNRIIKIRGLLYE